MTDDTPRTETIDCLKQLVAPGARMQRAHPQAGVLLELTGSVPGLSPDEQSSIAQLTQSLLRPHPSAKVSYGTEAGFLQQTGIPSIVGGPGSILVGKILGRAVCPDSVF